MSDIVKRLQAPAYWVSGSNEGHEGENDAPREAADTITRLTAENEKLRAALEPFARLYLWPFDNHLAKEIMADDDWCEEENDATEEEVFIRRKYIRIARAVFLGDNHE